MSQLGPGRWGQRTALPVEGWAHPVLLRALGVHMVCTDLAAAAVPIRAALSPLPALQVSTADQAWELLRKASAARHAAETQMNVHSSRSHCLLCLRVEGRSRLTSECCKGKRPAHTPSRAVQSSWLPARSLPNGEACPAFLGSLPPPRRRLVLPPLADRPGGQRARVQDRGHRRAAEGGAVHQQVPQASGVLQLRGFETACCSVCFDLLCMAGCPACVPIMAPAPCTGAHAVPGQPDWWAHAKHSSCWLHGLRLQCPGGLHLCACLQVGARALPKLQAHLPSPGAAVGHGCMLHWAPLVRTASCGAGLGVAGTRKCLSAAPWVESAAPCAARRNRWRAPARH